MGRSRYGAITTQVGLTGATGPIGPSGGPVGPAGPAGLLGPMGPFGLDGEDAELPYVIPGPPGISPAGGGGDLNGEVHLASIVAPVNASFGWVNQGAATITDNVSSVVLVGEAYINNYNINARTMAAPATPYTITALVLPMIVMKGFQAYGLLWRNVAAGTLAALELRVNGADGPLTVRSSKWTSPTAFSADYLFWSVAETIHWLRIADDGVNRTVSVSGDGVTWLALHSIGRTDFLTPDQVGFFVSGRNQVTPNVTPILRVHSWKVT